jgi:hypothetical protein
MTFAVAPSLYRRRACTTTAVKVTPSAAARAFAASSTSVGMRNGVVGVFATSDGPDASTRTGSRASDGVWVVGQVDESVATLPGRSKGCQRGRDEHALARDTVRLAGPTIAGDLGHEVTVATPVDTVKRFVGFGEPPEGVA